MAGHRHRWITVFSYGFWGYTARCRRCGKIATFVIREED